MAWAIVKHALLMIERNLIHAVKVSVVPVVLGLIVIGVAVKLTGFSLSADFTNPQSIPQGFFAMAMVLVVTFTIVASWIAVAWHRFVLLEEYPGFLPTFHGKEILNYIGFSIVAGLVVGLLVVVGGMVLATVLGLLGLVGAFPILSIILGMVATWLWLRLGIGLPARAIGRKLTISELFRMTAPASKTILGVAAILVGLNVVAGMVLSILSAGLPFLTILFELLVNWFTAMIGISVLTTFYGTIVEGRTLRD